jgi:DNA-dependent metalloprotease WSS1
MPLGFQRLNERVKRPNELINFIRPLPGKDEALSKDFLERVAAIAYPVMKANTITVMALEEFPPNREFWGRNFNAGEVIQLVLKSLDGRWLPFRQVQMVMMHELAHCKEMNHSRFFWRVRNGYADELKALWQRGYTGDGFWGAGRGVENGAYLTSQISDSGMVPESLCGGVYRRRRKRKARPEETDPELRKAKRVEQKQKRILKKFGPGGTALGADEHERDMLELSSKSKGKGKSRVAGSARARELRAAAALARFSTTKAEQDIKTEVIEDTSDTESLQSWSESEANLDETDRKRVNAEGSRLIRVCEEEDENDENVKREKQELLTDYFEVRTLRRHSSGPLADDPVEATVNELEVKYRAKSG